MLSDPSAKKYASNSAQAFANDNFNHAYTSLLKVLRTMVNGNATNAVFNRALGLMMALKNQARDDERHFQPGLHIGPSFEYQPVTPGVSVGS
ncbi:MAG TPA: hypothetical protein PLD10_00865 [Rhodopila sp.]|nr:hypothetical protein [Rhodopila sp.]